MYAFVPKGMRYFSFQRARGILTAKSMCVRVCAVRVVF